jgi:hypothetical protein
MGDDAATTTAIRFDNTNFMVQGDVKEELVL